MSAAEPAGKGAAARRAARGTTPPPSTRREASTPTAVRRQLDPDTLAALEEERDFLLRSLDDLEREHDAGDIDDTDFAELKDDYTARAASVLRALDDRRALVASSSSNRSWVRNAAALAVVAVLALGVGWFVFRDAGSRAPGQGVSGDARQDSANLVLQAQQSTGEAQVALGNGDTQTALDRYRDALDAYGKALAIAPANVEALTNRGWLYHNLALGAGAGAQADELDGYARQDLDAAVAAQSDYGPARVFRAVLARDAGRFDTADQELAAADLSTIPTYMDQILDGLRADIAAGLEGSAPTAP